MNALTCCFSGHRTLPTNKILQIANELEKVVISLIQRGVVYFGCGGAIGFDMLASFTILKLKKEYPFIKLILVLPCENQDKFWNDYDKFLNKLIFTYADKVVFCSKAYSNSCMHKRNRYLVENSSVCICYLTKQNGGTLYTVEYAKSKGLETINIADLFSSGNVV